MNYYEHHIGDYAEATMHLTFVEDAAYSRLLRKYYATEKPLPAEIKSVQRLIGARSKEEREAVSVVLDEFFDLREDGWHNARCDAEIKSFRDGEPERKAKKANESNRLKSHRDERASLFDVITKSGLHAPWNIGINELRAMAERCRAVNPNHETQPETQPETKLQRPATAPETPATATQTPYPDTRHQTPYPGDLEKSVDTLEGCRPENQNRTLPGGKPPNHEPDPDPEAMRRGRLCAKLRALGVDAAPHLMHSEAWKTVLERRTDEEIEGFAASKIAANPGKRIGLNYLAPGLLEDPRHPNKTASRRASADSLEARNAAVAAAWTPPELSKSIIEVQS